MSTEIKENVKLDAEPLSDAAAVKLFTTSGGRIPEIANKFVVRTVVYPVKISYKVNQFTDEIRTFVRAGEYCSEAQWAKALELEKQYPALQKSYRAMLKSHNMPVELSAPGNPLKATIIELK